MKLAGVGAIASAYRDEPEEDVCLEAELALRRVNAPLASGEREWSGRRVEEWSGGGVGEWSGRWVEE
jgi:hypothetical protein